MNRLIVFISGYSVLVALFVVLSVVIVGTFSISLVLSSMSVALVIEGIAYGFFLAWRSVVRSFRGSGLKPQVTNVQTPDISPGWVTGARRIVPNCSSYAHPHVHTFLDTGQVRCEEEFAAKANPFRMPGSTIGPPPGVSLPSGIGHYRLLVVLTFAALASYALIWVLPYLFPPAFGWAVIPDAIIAFASAEVVWEDAKAINKAFGNKIIAAGWWSLFAFLFSYVGVPIYTFERRKSAISNGR